MEFSFMKQRRNGYDGTVRFLGPTYFAAGGRRGGLVSFGLRPLDDLVWTCLIPLALKNLICDLWKICLGDVLFLA